MTRRSEARQQQGTPVETCGLIPPGLATFGRRWLRPLCQQESSGPISLLLSSSAAHHHRYHRPRLNKQPAWQDHQQHQLLKLGWAKMLSSRRLSGTERFWSQSTGRITKVKVER